MLEDCLEPIDVEVGNINVSCYVIGLLLHVLTRFCHYSIIKHDFCILFMLVSPKITGMREILLDSCAHKYDMIITLLELILY